MKKKIKASAIVITSIVSTVAVASGLAVGILLGKLLSPKIAPDFGAIDTGLEDDYDALMTRFASDKSINSYRPYEVANISWLNFANETHTHSVTLGTVEASVVKQKVFGHDVRDGDSFFSESLSYSSMKKCGSRFYQEGDSVKAYTPTDIKDNGTATWKESTLVNETLKSHEEKWGKTLDRPIIYIISEKTVTNESIQQTSNGYVVELDLDPKTSVSRYIRQMVNISNLDKAPAFSYVHLTFTLSNDFVIQELGVKEEYVVYVVGKNESKGTLTQKFYTNSSETIPDLNTNYAY